MLTEPAVHRTETLFPKDDGRLLSFFSGYLWKGNETNMKNFKKILGVILAMCFLMAFATGCSKTEEGGSEPVDTGVQKDTSTAILVVSFGTSYNDSREKTIGAVENAIAKAYPQYEVRRAFTSQIIIDKL
ncbi:MAG: sirohydrochlorin cobaltochelatase, partial [Clostridia bacterium]|nr:sirohydrochlorin cobaltochelatase [Clostridia bacterium]